MPNTSDNVPTIALSNTTISQIASKVKNLCSYTLPDAFKLKVRVRAYDIVTLDNGAESKNYLSRKENKVMTGEEMKKKALSQRGLGSFVPAHLNDSAFYNPTVSQNQPIVKKSRKNVSEPTDIRYSRKALTIAMIFWVY